MCSARRDVRERAAWHAMMIKTQELMTNLPWEPNTTTFPSIVLMIKLSYYYRTGHIISP